MTAEKKANLIKGLFTGIIFGFLLQKGGATRYNVIIGQLVLEDFTVLKIMLTAAAVGMVGIYILKNANLAELAPKSGSVFKSVTGGLLFGIGFALLGYCPGTAAGAAGQGNLDALIPGILGMIGGSAIFANIYPALRSFLSRGEFKALTFPEKYSISPWKIIIPLLGAILIFFYFLEKSGL